MIDTILGTVNTLLGWIPVPGFNDSRIANAIRALAAGLVLYGGYALTGGK
jgi:hypothetical protein